MSPPNSDLAISVQGPWDQAFAEEPFLLTVEVRRLPEHRSSVSLHSVQSNDPDISLDTTLFQPRITVRPEETYRFVLPLTVSRPKTIRLAAISLSYQVESNAPLFAASVAFGAADGGEVVFQPSLRREIDIDLQSVCEYPHGTKVVLKLAHRRSTSFQDFQMNLEPRESLFAGKSMLRIPELKPNQSESLELIVRGSELQVTLTAGVDGNRSLDRRTLRIDPPLAIEQKRFRFLEPRTLSHSQATIVQAVDSGRDQAVPERDGVFVVSSGLDYRIVVKPNILLPNEVEEVTLESFETIFRLRKVEQRDGAWHFSISVHYDPLMRLPERIYGRNSSMHRAVMASALASRCGFRAGSYASRHGRGSPDSVLGELFSVRGNC